MWYHAGMLRRIFVLWLLLALPGLGEATGTITVYNQTPEDVYVTIAGRNQGEIAAWSYDTYTVPLGEHRVEAYTDTSSAYKYVKLSSTYPDNTWTVTPGDF